MLAVIGAGLGAGIVVTAIGAGSLVSFPILLAVGVNPLVANVSNTVGLVPGGLSGTWGYRSEMAGYPHLVRRVAITSVLGSLAGIVELTRAAGSDAPPMPHAPRPRSVPPVG